MTITVDVHLVASDTEAWVTPMAAAGATRFILQYESVCNSIDISASTTATTSVTDRLLSIAHKVRQSGMSCGICIKPSTPIIEIESLLLEIWTDGSPLFELVDILTVNPGHAGQIFNIDVLEKVKYLVSSVSLRHAVKYVAVDGGVNENTIKLVVAAGANVIVAGSAVFGSNRCISQKDEPVIENIQKLISTLLNK